MAKTQHDKSRYFTFLLYPDSAPADFLEKLKLLDIPMAISPLHDKDVAKRVDERKKEMRLFLQDNRNVWSNEQVEAYENMIAELVEPIYKKSHYHVIYIAKNPVTAQAVRNKLVRALGKEAVNTVKIIQYTVRNMYNYLTHESADAIAKKKHKYDKNDIIEINNFDVSRYDVLDAEAKADLLDTALDVIINYGFKNMIQLEHFIASSDNYTELTTSKLREVAKGNNGMLRLYFDGNYQQSVQRDKEREKELLDSLDLGRRTAQTNKMLSQLIFGIDKPKNSKGRNHRF